MKTLAIKPLASLLDELATALSRDRLFAQALLEIGSLVRNEGFDGRRDAGGVLGVLAQINNITVDALADTDVTTLSRAHTDDLVKALGEALQTKSGWAGRARAALDKLKKAGGIGP